MPSRSDLGGRSVGDDSKHRLPLEVIATTEAETATSVLTTHGRPRLDLGHPDLLDARVGRGPS